MSQYFHLNVIKSYIKTYINKRSSGMPRISDIMKNNYKIVWIVINIIIFVFENKPC